MLTDGPDICKSIGGRAARPESGRPQAGCRKGPASPAASRTPEGRTGQTLRASDCNFEMFELPSRKIPDGFRAIILNLHQIVSNLSNLGL